MIEPQIEICVDDDKRWWVQLRRTDGTVDRRVYGNRKALIDTFPHMLAQVRGIPFPSISEMLPDETITIGTPNRRKED